MTDRTTLFSVTRAGTEFGATIVDGRLLIGITNTVAHTGVAVELTRDDARTLARALIAHMAPAPTPCAKCGEPAVATARRLYQVEREPFCTTCLPYRPDHPLVSPLQGHAR